MARYTLAELREEARINTEALDAEVTVEARKWVKELGITPEQAYTRVMNATPEYRERYMRFRNPNAYAAHFSEETAQEEVKRMMEEIHGSKKTPLHQKLDTMAKDFAIRHDISYESAFSKVLAMNPDLQVQWVNEQYRDVTAA